MGWIGARLRLGDRLEIYFAERQELLRYGLFRRGTAGLRVDDEVPPRLCRLARVGALWARRLQRPELAFRA